jgi:hypothetical protein
MLGIWCGLDEELEVSKSSLNGFGKLEWICIERLTSVTFLDLTIKIDASSNKIKTKPIRSLNISTCTYHPSPLTQRHASKEPSWATQSDTGSKIPASKTSAPCLRNLQSVSVGVATKLGKSQKALIKQQVTSMRKLC